MTNKRAEVPQNDRWNVESLFPSFADWQKHFEAQNPDQTPPRWPQLAKLQGKLGESAETLKEAFDVSFAIDRELTRLYTYAHLRHDEDITEDAHKIAYNRILNLLHDFQQETSWLQPEVLALPEATLKEYLASSTLVDYHFYLEKMVRLKPHTLSPESEALLALAGKALETPHKAFSAINNADFKFGTVLDAEGNEHEVTHAKYSLYLHDQDRLLRKNAFMKLHEKFGSYENTLCELAAGQVQNHLLETRARGYSTCLEAALYPKNIDTSVYHTLIQTVNDNSGALHQYVELRKQLLAVDELHPYDMYVPLTADIDIKMTYREAEEVVIESVAPLGAEYQNLLKKGLESDRWVDRYENENKRSGAYSSGCYDSVPYVLMNYKELLRDVFVLAHEAGHSMHSLLSNSHQPYQYSQYPIFVAEVASTFNEELLMRLLLERAGSEKEKIFLLNQKIEDIRATFFRQTMFAEFELYLHEMAEQNTPLTPTLLKEKYRELNGKFFGPTIVFDEEAETEWSRIPHFYYNFYVYQYATGISAALSLSEIVTQGGDKERADYLSFLKGGYSRYPIDLLQGAGVDMRSPKPVEMTISRFKTLVEELDRLIGVAQK